MAVQVSNGVTTLTPTAWKWMIGAVPLFFMPPYGTIAAIFFALIASGKMQRLELSQEGLKLRNWWSSKTYKWDDIHDFRVYKLKSGFITAANMVSFSLVKNDGKMWNKAAKFLSGGTHSIPVLGLKPKKMIMLMEAYRQGVMRNDELIHSVLGTQAVAPNRAQAQAPASVSAPKMDTPPVPSAVSDPAPSVKSGTKAAKRPVFGAANKTPAASKTFGKVKAGGSPLVQDSRSRKRMVGR